ncbi:MAG: ribulose-phosphate 3-epimerase, partial [Gammaproteobacteria bacterium]
CVPRFGLYPEILKRLRIVTNMPVDVHMMVDNPEPYIGTFAEAGADVFYVHAENNANLHRTIERIKKSGMRPGVVLNPATSLHVLDYILNEIDFILLMAINPGILGQSMIDVIYDKLSGVKERIADRPIKIAVDGGVSPESSAKMIKAGADILVCGSSTIFRPEEGSLAELTRKFLCRVNSELEKR